MSDIDNYAVSCILSINIGGLVSSSDLEIKSLRKIRHLIKYCKELIMNAS